MDHVDVIYTYKNNQKNKIRVKIASTQFLPVQFKTYVRHSNFENSFKPIKGGTVTPEQNPELGIRANLAEMQRLLNETQKLLESSRSECLQPSPLANTPGRETKTPEQVEQSRMQMKQALALAFWKSVKQQRLTQKAAGQLIGMSQQKVSDLMRQNVAGLSERKIIECLTSIGCDIRITVSLGSGQVAVETT